MLDKEITIIGYHGTEIKNVNNILKEGLSHTQRDDHWLGQGFYLYKDFALAQWWAKKKFKQNYNQPAVIKVELVVREEKLLDLDTVEGLNRFFREMKRLLALTSYRFRFKNDERIKNLCFALDLLKEELDIWVIIRTFSKDNPSYGDENIPNFEDKYFTLPLDFAYLETQICVSKNECVKNKACCYPKPKTTWS